MYSKSCAPVYNRRFFKLHDKCIEANISKSQLFKVISIYIPMY